MRGLQKKRHRGFQLDRVENFLGSRLENQLGGVSARDSAKIPGIARADLLPNPGIPVEQIGHLLARGVDDPQIAELELGGIEGGGR
jgi:hypothetical protein